MSVAVFVGSSIILLLLRSGFTQVYLPHLWAVGIVPPVLCSSRFTSAGHTGDRAKVGGLVLQHGQSCFSSNGVEAVWDLCLL